MKLPVELEHANKATAEAAYDSAFFYGNLTEKEWIEALTRMLNSASRIGIYYGSQFSRLEDIRIGD